MTSSQDQLWGCACRVAPKTFRFHRSGRNRGTGSHAAVSVIGTYGEYSTPDNLRVGDVYSIQAPMAAAEVEWRRKRVAG